MKPALYDTFTLTFAGAQPEGNPFAYFPKVEFCKGDRRFRVEGFFDGDGAGGQQGTVWKVRFMPDEEGKWTYTWRFLSWSGEGSFEVVARQDTKLKGHVKLDPGHHRGLRYDNGAPFYAILGKWFSAKNLRPSSPTYKDQVTRHNYLDDQTILAYLDALAATHHNTTLYKVCQYPLNDDCATWDLAFCARYDRLLEAAADRGLYVWLNFFDTWGRALGSPFEWNTDSDAQVLDPWHENFLPETEFYLRYFIARWAGYANVMWELGNECDHAPNSGSEFVRLTNDYYLPWIHKYDPYRLPIGLSEGIWQQANVDIGFLHQTNQLPRPEYEKPVIMNELVSGGFTPEALAYDGLIRDPSQRLSYRRTFWRMFTYGGAGCGEATWLDLKAPVDEAVLDVMRDHQRLGETLSGLKVDLNLDRSPSRSGAGSPWRSHLSCRAGTGICPLPAAGAWRKRPGGHGQARFAGWKVSGAVAQPRNWRVTWRATPRSWRRADHACLPRLHRGCRAADNGGEIAVEAGLETSLAFKRGVSGSRKKNCNRRCGIGAPLAHLGLANPWFRTACLIKQVSK